MEKKYIYIDYELACLIRTQHYIPLSKNQFNKSIFTIDELERVDRLTITNCKNIDDLSKLPNLTKLVIENPSSNLIVDDETLNSKMNNIGDFRVIESLKKLTHLEITNDFTLKNIDVRNLKNLKVLILKNNSKLREINGLGELKKLKIIICYGCNVLFDTSARKYLENTKKAILNILDITAYPYFLSHFSNEKDFFETVLQCGSKLKFAESIALFDAQVYSYSMLSQVNKEIKSIIEKTKNKTEKEVIEQFYEHIITETEFDYEGLKNRSKVLNQNNISDLTIQETAEFSNIHSSYNCLVKHKCNCEGMVNALRLLLATHKIPSYNVHCSIKEKSYSESDINHAILRIDGKEGNYYYDPAEECITYHENSNRFSWNWYMIDYNSAVSRYNLSANEEQKDRSLKI